MMELDFPPAPSLRSVGRKRARSPTSPPSLDRPPKRISGPAGRTPSPLNCPQRVPQTNVDLPSTFLECKTPEDWVVKTGGLKLDSPSVGLGRVPLPEIERWTVDSTVETTVDDAHEITMTDHDSTTAMEVWPISSEGSDASSPFIASGTTHTSFSSSLPLSAHQTPYASQPSNVQIRIQPATPSSDRSLARSPMIPSSPLSPSATSSGTWSSPTRKPRVTMGPRPDCEKCRMGVKGHWMHVD